MELAPPARQPAKAPSPHPPRISELAGCPSALAATVALLFACAGCGDLPAAADGGAADASAPGPAAALADYGATERLYAAPWPDERLRRPDGTVSVASFPNPRGVRIVSQLVDVLEGAAGFGVSSTIYFPLDAPIRAESLPADPRQSLAAEASVLLVDVDPDSPTRGELRPIDVAFAAQPGPFGAPNLLAVMPLQGRPLWPNRLYAAVVTTDVQAADGSPLGVAPATADLLEGQRPDGLSEAAFAAHQDALTALREAGIEGSRVAVTAVFRTWDPTAELAAARAHLDTLPAPTPDAPPSPAEVFDDFCVYQTTVQMPDFQGGTPPYEGEGGAWVYGAGGRLEVQRPATANLWITVPRAAMPEAGFSTAVFVRTGGGGDRPLVDRGPRSVAGAMADEAGTGPASHFARAGFVGVSVDGPLGGLRNETGWDEQFAIFNINNPRALRDNVRQSALELMLLPRVLDELRFDASSCPGLTTPAADGRVALDTSRLAIMGHSMGATIAPLAVALEPAYRAAVLSGAGASWIENVIYKRSPIEVRPAAESLLQYTVQGRELTEHDPVLALLQWAGEPADPQVYARAIVDHPLEGAARHVLMFQGILDTYIPPPVANPLSLALGLDLGGEPLDEALDGYAPLRPLLDLSGASAIELPVSGNRADGAVTAVVVQHPEDGIEDGHEVVFQTAAPQLQYRCFLQSLAAGVPSVPPAAAAACE